MHLFCFLGCAVVVTSAVFVAVISIILYLSSVVFVILCIDSTLSCFVVDSISCPMTSYLRFCHRLVIHMLYNLISRSVLMPLPSKKTFIHFI